MNIVIFIQIKLLRLIHRASASLRVAAGVTMATVLRFRTPVCSLDGYV